MKYPLLNFFCVALVSSQAAFATSATPKTILCAMALTSPEIEITELTVPMAKGSFVTTTPYPIAGTSSLVMGTYGGEALVLDYDRNGVIDRRLGIHDSVSEIQYTPAYLVFRSHNDGVTLFETATHKQVFLPPSDTFEPIPNSHGEPTHTTVTYSIPPPVIVAHPQEKVLLVARKNTSVPVALFKPSYVGPQKEKLREIPLVRYPKPIEVMADADFMQNGNAIAAVISETDGADTLNLWKKTPSGTYVRFSETLLPTLNPLPPGVRLEKDYIVLSPHEKYIVLVRNYQLLFPDGKTKQVQQTLIYLPEFKARITEVVKSRARLLTTLVTSWTFETSEENPPQPVIEPPHFLESGKILIKNLQGSFDVFQISHEDQSVDSVGKLNPLEEIPGFPKVFRTFPTPNPRAIAFSTSTGDVYLLKDLGKKFEITKIYSRPYKSGSPLTLHFLDASLTEFIISDLESGTPCKLRLYRTKLTYPRP